MSKKIAEAYRPKMEPASSNRKISTQKNPYTRLRSVHSNTGIECVDYHHFSTSSLRPRRLHRVGVQTRNDVVRIEFCCYVIYFIGHAKRLAIRAPRSTRFRLAQLTDFPRILHHLPDFLDFFKKDLLEVSRILEKVFLLFPESSITRNSCGCPKKEPIFP